MRLLSRTGERSAANWVLREHASARPRRLLLRLLKLFYASDTVGAGRLAASLPERSDWVKRQPTTHAPARVTPVRSGSASSQRRPPAQHGDVAG